MASERVRQRETLKYYQAWLDSSVGFEAKATTETTRRHADGSQLDSSKDLALAAFAQLGCLRLNVKRGIITLISTSRQYILAEATRSMSLITHQGVHGSDDDIWFGNASIPRSQGISGAALAPPDYTAHSDGTDSFTSPALVINDVAEHPEYCSRAYAGNGISFYCGVPILTKDRTPIGVYTFSDDKPRDGLRPDELRFLSEMAVVVMRHLESVKNEAARFRGEAMVLGLGRFVQGALTISSHNSSHHPHSSPQKKPASDLIDTPPEPRHFKGLEITAADPSALRTVSRSKSTTQDPVDASDHSRDRLRHADQPGIVDSDHSAATPTSFRHADRKSLKPGSGQRTTDSIFSRAANILRECCGADGVLFFDAVSTNLAKRASPTAFKSVSSNPVVSDSDNDTKSQRSGAASEQPTSESIDSEEADSNGEGAKMCSLLGFSMDVTEQSNTNIEALRNLTMTEGTLRRFIRKYPTGKVFFPTHDGIASSDDNETSLSGTTSDGSVTSMPGYSGLESSASHGERIRINFTEELKRLVPQAQSIIWLPLWDFSKQRWSAGAFVWTKMAEQLIAAQDDLVYLKTFANSIMIEVARQDAAVADETKSTFIANISHELRSPLHGVVGSCELLKDTRMDDYQASLVHAIEVCSQTLNDTVNHVLDYTKINQLTKRGGRLSGSNTAQRRHSNALANKSSSLEGVFDLVVLIEDVVETVWTSQSSQQRLRRQSNAHKATLPDTNDQRNVQVLLKLAHRGDWRVQSQPGSIKRILTNLVQNAFKYTDRGSVTIALSLRGANSKTQRRELSEKSREDEHSVTISVVDTGRGMSNDFVRNHAFTPFSQESSFSDGTGLGLSIVQLIVDSLGGEIEMKSRPGVGTEIKVHLSLSRPDSPRKRLLDDDPFPDTAQFIGKSICFVQCADVESEFATRRRLAIETTLSDTASAWFGLNSKTAKSFADTRADFYICTSNSKPEDVIRLVRNGSLPTGSSIILLVSNPLEKLKVSSDLDMMEGCDVPLEIALHPLGPRKLGHILAKCLSRTREGLTGVSTTEREQPINSDIEQNTRYRLNRGCEQQEDLRKNGETLSQRTPPSEPAESAKIDATTEPDSQSSTSPLQRTSTLEHTILNSSRARSKRILLVDDNIINLNILKAAMKKAKLAFEEAHDGLEALEKFRRAARADVNSEQPFSHVLMDINMPVMDGIESTRLIRRFERDTQNAHKGRTLVRKMPSSDYGGPALKASRSKSLVSEGYPDNDYIDDDASDITGSIPMSPIDQPNPSPQSQLTRPVLSHIQTGHDGPARARTYTGEAQALPTALFNLTTRAPHKPATIIALSGVAFGQTQRDMYDAGADMFLAKPVKLKELTKLLIDEEDPTH